MSFVLSEGVEMGVLNESKQVWVRSLTGDFGTGQNSKQIVWEIFYKWSMTRLNGINCMLCISLLSYLPKNTTYGNFCSYSIIKCNSKTEFIAGLINIIRHVT